MDQDRKRLEHNRTTGRQDLEMATTPTSVRRVRAPLRAGGRLADDADATRLT
jgi:hypothetical protein